MKLLITNDDGLGCDGIIKLFEALKEKGHDVRVLAPDRNRSAVSMGINMSAPLEMRKIRENVYTLSGLPADCVIHGVCGVFGSWKPDAVISGINRGSNLGDDLLYSGTAAAARQASIMNIPGIALSLAFDNFKDYNPNLPDSRRNYGALAEFAAENLEKLINLCSAQNFLNINAPDAETYKGARFCNLSKRIYKDNVIPYNAPNGLVYSFFASEPVESVPDPDSDVEAVCGGYVALSLVSNQPVICSLQNQDENLKKLCSKFVF
ncbi:MAG: 5'/3'-nucleotidase SurE [Treponemataceae bacterium]|nr:5'/3'-nucleotidase SurE [Treponemataceae bacterium]